MKLPLSWIKEIIDLNTSARQIALSLTRAGLEVDALLPQPLSFEKVIIGQVIHVEKHPNADKLSVAQVNDGVNTYQVVCGAPNCREGMKTAFAKVGATLKNGEIKIKQTSLRGVDSCGMLCSEKELGLGEESSGIMEFHSHIEVGADIAEIYADMIFEISLTPNLGHCASVVGVARELHAATAHPLKYPAISFKEDHKSRIEDFVSVDVRDRKKCPRYACRLIQNVKIGPSPAWLQQRLLACDLRPINNVVDATNYVMIELGHPLHAFDYHLLEGNSLIIRNAHEGETLITLDGKEKILSSEDLLICDQKKPIAIAGVMGAENSEVSEKTADVLLESAYFDPKTIRKTSKRLSMQTEASRRFERGADPQNVLKALDRAAMLIEQIAGGNISKGAIDSIEEEFPSKIITCRLKKIHDLLGFSIGVSEVEAIFQRLEMAYDWNGSDTFTVEPPTYRGDINEEIDLVEEVARIYGYDNIPKPVPKFTTSNIPHAPIYLFENAVRCRLLTEGLQEFITCDLIGPGLLNIVQQQLIPEEAMIKVLNPSSIEQSVLRTSLLPGLLHVAKHNYVHEKHDVRGFEIGRVHFKQEEHYKEQSVAGILLMGKRQPHHWDLTGEKNDFYDLKGILETLLDELGIRSYFFKNDTLPIFHPGRQASIYADSYRIGSLGEVHPSIVRRLDIPERIYFAEIDLHDLFKVQKQSPKFRPLPIFPSSTRDLTLTLDKKIEIQEPLNAARSVSSRILESVELADLYSSDKLGADKRNATFHFVYRDAKKTISQEAVDREHARITAHLEAFISLSGGKKCDP